MREINAVTFDKILGEYLFQFMHVSTSVFVDSHKNAFFPLFCSQQS